MGLLEPSNGEIRYNGKLISLSREEWWSHVAYLPQQVFVIDDSLKNNIALGVNPDEIDDVLIDEAVRQSSLQEVVNLLQFGVNTNIGERGVKLSGGQRQRIALARAFYHQRDVLQIPN